MEDVLEKFKNEVTGKSLVFNLIDILIISLLLYVVFAFLKKRNTQRLVKYIVATVLIAAILSSELLQLKITGIIARQLIYIVIIAIAILFTPELKRQLWRISSPKISKEVYSTDYNCSEEDLRDAIDDIVRAVQNMSKKNVGALIIIAPAAIPVGILESGTKMDSFISSSLLECLFNTKAPLHDGAVFVKGNKILAAGCFLPLTQNTSIDQELGTRHRAAIGITETNSVVSIIVSEETGVISVATDGEVDRYFDSDMLRDTLEQIYGLKATVNTSSKKGKKKL